MTRLALALVLVGVALVALAGALVYIPLGVALLGGGLIAFGLLGVPVDRR